MEDDKSGRKVVMRSGVFLGSGWCGGVERVFQGGKVARKFSSRPHVSY